MSDLGSWRGRRVHFVGAGGIGMSGLALVARELGAEVTGSDRKEGPRLDMLRRNGIPVAVGHDADNVPANGELVYSSAVADDNVERARAREVGVREVRRGELLAELAKLRPCIAVAGAHGKTTTAAMIVEALQGAGQRPSYVVGGELLATGTSAAWADGDWLVVEADESDRSFLELEPEIAVVTNVEVDHFREYGSHHELEEAFRVFLAGADQAVIWDRPELLALREGSVVAFEVADIDLATGGSRFGWRGHDLALPVAGTHNARNAAAALEACRLAGADLDLAVAALANYRGASRRFELVGETSAGASVYDDYAVHPTAIRATLDAARTLEPTRLVAVLQPFGHHRVRNMADAFRDAIAQADLALILDIYSPRPPAEEDRGVSSDWISGAELIRVPDIDAARDYLENELRAGDLCVTLGGDEMGELARRLVG